MILLQAKPRKNVETDIVGDKMGRIHLGRQDLDELQTRKMKGLKRSRDVVEEDKQDQVDENSDLAFINDGDDGGEGVDLKRTRL